MTRYAHLASFASGIVVGSQVNAGTIIGTIGTTGNSTGIHLHLSVYRWNSSRNEWEITDPFGWDPWLSSGQQNGDPLYNCNGEISYNLCVGGWPKSVSGNSTSSSLPNVRNLGGWLGTNLSSEDTTAPTASWSSPSNGSTISSRSVTLTANASDNSGGSGVKQVQFSAKWDNTWRSVGNVSSAPYTLNWDMCNSGVPNGDFELGLEVVDNSDNHYVYSEHYTNYHITKNYSCTQSTTDTTPPSGSWTSPGNGQTINSQTVTLSANASDNSGGSGVREVRWSAKYGNTWYGVGSDTSSPYSVSWDMCASGVPIGDVELGMEVWDNANNKWVYSEHYSNYHINFNYTCTTSSSGGWETWGWQNKYLAGYDNWHGTITWDNNYPYVWESIFAVEGTLKAMISSSMHAALFAYVQNVPVIAYPQDLKIRYFFEDRGFPQCLYTSTDNLSSGIEAILLNQPDYSQAISSDKASADELLYQISEILQSPQPYGYSKESRFFDTQFNKLQESYYLANMQTMMDISFRDIAILDLTLENQELKKSSKTQLVQTNFNSSGSFRSWLSDHFLFISRYIKYFRYYRLILGSGLFDKNWYVTQYPDVAGKKVDPIWHYLFWGGFENRDPGPNFSSSWYLLNYPDVTEKGMNPLVHYLQFGRIEGRQISIHR